MNPLNSIRGFMPLCPHLRTAKNTPHIFQFFKFNHWFQIIMYVIKNNIIVTSVYRKMSTLVHWLKGQYKQEKRKEKEENRYWKGQYNQYLKYNNFIQMWFLLHYINKTFCSKPMDWILNKLIMIGHIYSPKPFYLCQNHTLNLLRP